MIVKTETRQNKTNTNARSAPVKLKTSLYLSVAAIGVAVLLSTPAAQLRAQQSAPPGVSVGDGDLGGVVSGAERA